MPGTWRTISPVLMISRFGVSERYVTPPELPSSLLAGPAAGAPWKPPASDPDVVPAAVRSRPADALPAAPQAAMNTPTIRRTRSAGPRRPAARNVDSIVAAPSRGSVARGRPEAR